MAFCGITLETCAGGEIAQSFAYMVEMAARHDLPVTADINGIKMTVMPNAKPAEIYHQWFLAKQSREA